MFVSCQRKTSFLKTWNRTKCSTFIAILFWEKFHFRYVPVLRVNFLNPIEFCFEKKLESVRKHKTCYKWNELSFNFFSSKRKLTSSLESFLERNRCKIFNNIWKKKSLRYGWGVDWKGRGRIVWVEDCLRFEFWVARRMRKRMWWSFYMERSSMCAFVHKQRIVCLRFFSMFRLFTARPRVLAIFAFAEMEDSWFLIHDRVTIGYQTFTPVCKVVQG